MHKKSGFTLIELVIVIILLGILAATAIPKFIGKGDFEGQAYRDQLLQILKTVQQQAMSCDDACRASLAGKPSDPLTGNAYACNRVVITTERFGIPENCGSDFLINVSLPQLGMSDTEAAATSIEFSVTNTTQTGIVEFNSLGIASGCELNDRGCDIKIKSIGEQELKIHIEPQGYIHEQ